MTNVLSTRLFCRRTALLAAALSCALAMGAACSPPSDGSDIAKRIDKMSPEDQLTYLRGLESGGRSDAFVYFYMGNSFFSLEQPDSAVVCYGRAIKADSSFTKAWVNMGLAYDSQRQPQAAQRAFEEALTIDPRDVLALCHLGSTYFSRGQVDEAIDFYMKALEIDPDSPQAHYNLGLAFADAKVFREALTEWQLVMKLDPDGELGQTASENVELIKTYMELENE